MAYDYKFLKSPDGRKRPFVPVKITNPHTGLSNNFMCLLDTGADGCLFNYGTSVEALGHNLKGNGNDVKESVQFGVDGNETPVWKHTFILELLSPNSLDVIWKSDEILIDCHESRKVPNILGTNDFLKHFTITFDYENDLATLHL